MEKKLKTVITILAIGIFIYFLFPFVKDKLPNDHSGILNSSSITFWSFITAAIAILFGVRKLIYYAGTADDKVKFKVKVLLNFGLFFLILPYFLEVLFYLIDEIFSLKLHYIVAFLHKSKLHLVGFAALFLWGIKIIWENKDNMDDDPVFEEFTDFFSSLTRYGWVIFSFFVLLGIGYIYLLVNGLPDARPKNSVITLTASGRLFLDENSSIKKTDSVNKNDTVKTIHQIMTTRMLITTKDGKHGWFEIPFIKSDEGWNGYLFKYLYSNELKISPDRNSKSIKDQRIEGKQVRFNENADVKIIEFRNEPEWFQKHQRASPHAIWAKIQLTDTVTNSDFTGWLPYSRIRLHGQMKDGTYSFIWTPLKWINTKLGNGFFAGLFTIIFFVAFVFTVPFYITRFISTRLRFIPNLILAAILVFLTFSTVSSFYSSFFDPSAFNWDNWHNEFAHILYLGLTGLIGIGIMKRLIQAIYEVRCTNCKHWDGYVYSRELLNRDERKYKLWTETRYTDGTKRISNERYETEIDEDWKDFCECGRCGYRWSLQRQESYKK